MRVRIRFSKLGKVRFIGHRDVARVWERTLRKAGVPVAYSEGFSPRPRVAFGLALPTGAESVAEFLDVEVAGEVQPEDLRQRVAEALPAGFAVLAAAVVDRSDPSLQEDVVACSWELQLDGPDLAAAEAAVEAALRAESLPLERVRKGERRVDDLRPALEHLSLEQRDAAVVLVADTATRPRGMRPGELLAVCFPNAPEPDDLARRVLRTNQWIERDGARRELLPLDAADAPHTQAVCA